MCMSVTVQGLSLWRVQSDRHAAVRCSLNGLTEQEIIICRMKRRIIIAILVLMIDMVVWMYCVRVGKE